MADTKVLLQSIQGVSESWKAFDWKEKQTAIDQTLLASKEAREQSKSARGKLADATKQFRRSIKSLQQAAAALQEVSTPENTESVAQAVDVVAKECRGIVSSYKDEIDNLTRRCKSSETSYSTLTQSLLELADPAVVLETCCEQMSLQGNQTTELLQTVEKLQNEVDRIKDAHKSEMAQQQKSSMSKKDHEELIELRREVAEYEVEFRSLKNQDIKIRKLEARIAELQTDGEEELQNQVEKAKVELAETEGRRAAEALEREAAMERKVQTLELQLRAERAGREATQEHLLEADEGVSRREAAWEAQRQILIGDTERLREELQVSSRERDELRLKVAALQGEGKKSPALASTTASVEDLMLERSAYEAEVAELSETATLLRDELRLKEEALVEEKRTNQIKFDSLEHEKASLKTKLVSLESQLASAPSQSSVEKMRRELRILKRLEYNADDVDVDRDPEIAGVNEGEDKDLESVLVSKLRRAESDLVTERVTRTDLVKECESLKKARDDANRAKEEAEKLVASLEKDLANAIASPVSQGASSRTSVSSLAPGENPAMLQSVLDPNAPPPSPPKNPSPVTSSSAVEKAEDDHSVATIVMAQRDRLRARCEALEAERDSFKRELQGQVTASESLKTDNTKLYEKVRYLQNYSKAPSSRGAYGRDRDLDLEALEQRYEASVDPFRQFSKTERQRKLNEMSPMERTVFVVAKTVLATKEMRTALFFYVLVLHLLVFVTTYHWSHADQCGAVHFEHLAHLPPNPADHVREDLQAAAAAGKDGN